jgi:hypothetical protein
LRQWADAGRAGQVDFVLAPRIASTHLVFELCTASNAAGGHVTERSMCDPDGHAFLIA